MSVYQDERPFDYPGSSQGDVGGTMSDEQIQRLEDSDPSYDDGSWGGDHCKPHGVYVGTPGGADFMCQLCEDGLTYWVPDPCYELAVTIQGQEYPQGLRLWTSDFGTRRGLRAMARIRREIRRLTDFEPLPITVVWFSMREERAGRWEDPYLNIDLDVGMRGRPARSAMDLEGSIAEAYRLPVDAIYVEGYDQEGATRYGYTYTKVVGTIDRRELDEGQLVRAARLERQE